MEQLAQLHQQSAGGEAVGAERADEVDISLQRAVAEIAAVVAEGVETADSLQWLARIGCDAAQGYHIGRPMPAQDLRRWVASRAP